MSDPITATSDGVQLDVEVVPGADEDAFPAGYNPWRGRIKAKVRAQPQDGQANQALCELVAASLALDARSVQVVRGQTSRQKTLSLHGAQVEAVRDQLRGVLET